MQETFAAQALRIYVGDSDQWQGRPLYAALVAHLRAAGIAGVTAFHGVEGYGAHGKVHTERIEAMFDSLPVVVEAIDTSEKIAAALPALETMLTEGLITLCDIQAIRVRKYSPPA